MALIDKIYEHLKTKKKYNTLQLKYDILKEEYETKVIELNMEKKTNIKLRNIWEEKLKEQEEEIIKLKKRKVKKQ